MAKKSIARFLRTTAIAALLCALTAPAVLAQTPAPAKPPSEEVVVTGARQRAEAVRDVPIAVTTFSAQQIAEAGIARPADFIALTPNVQFIQTTNVGETQVHIRGVIQPRDSEPSFAYVADGVLVPNPNAFNQELADIRGIEVIKGPIGSIYGRNAIGGAILINTQKPSDTFEALGKASYETEGEEYKVGGYVSGPIAQNIAGRLTVNYTDRKGYFENLTRRAKEDPFTETLARARIVAQLSPKVELDLQAGWGKIDGYAFNFNNQTAGTPGFVSGVNTGNTSIPFVGNLKSFNDQERWNAQARLTWDTSLGEVSAYVAHNELKERMGGEGAADLALFGLLGPPGPQVPAQSAFFTDPTLFEGYGPTDRDGAQDQTRNQKDTSVEVRLVSNTGGPIEYVVGAYYIDFSRDVVLLTGNVGFGNTVRTAPRLAIGAPGVQGTGGANDNQAWAVFGQLTWNVTDALELSGALRYDQEDRENSNLVANAVAPVGVKRSASFDKWQPRISARYKLTPDWNVYATYGEGFRSGGFNPLGSRNAIITIDGKTNTTVQDAFGPETSKSAEIGVKGRMFNKRLDFNAAAFATKVDNAHYFQFFPFSLTRAISLVNENEIYGAEFDFTARVSDNLTLFGGAGVLESEIKANREDPTSVGKTFPFTPKHQLLLGGQYTRALGNDLELHARLEWSQTGKMFFDTDNTRGTARPTLDLVNARLGISNQRWSASLFSRNLLDEKYNVDAVVLNVPGVTTFNFVTKGMPRTVGVELSLKM
jgi:iron complex outermembrane receptor protein